MGSLAHIAVLTSICSSACSASSGLVIFWNKGTYTPARLILFSVIVPVLSVQITVALPSASTVFICFTTTPIFINRHAPSAINVLKATGISSGKILIAIVNAFIRLSITLPDW
ncbi:hypothetical protein D3C85_1448030 [compost metagenome]